MSGFVRDVWRGFYYGILDWRTWAICVPLGLFLGWIWR